MGLSLYWDAGISLIILEWTGSSVANWVKALD